jgi:hypothetical protein
MELVCQHRDELLTFTGENCSLGLGGEPNLTGLGLLPAGPALA